MRKKEEEKKKKEKKGGGAVTAERARNREREREKEREREGLRGTHQKYICFVSTEQKRGVVGKGQERETETERAPEKVMMSRKNVNNLGAITPYCSPKGRVTLVSRQPRQKPPTLAFSAAINLPLGDSNNPPLAFSPCPLRLLLSPCRCDARAFPGVVDMPSSNRGLLFSYLAAFPTLY